MELELGKAQPTYGGLLILRLNEIWKLWSQNDPEGALILCLRLADTLMLRKIKKKLKKMVAVIRVDLAKAYGVGGVDWYQTQKNRNRLARKVAEYWLPKLYGELSDYLDEWGFYEIPSRRLKAKDFKELEKVES